MCDTSCQSKIECPRLYDGFLCLFYTCLKYDFDMAVHTRLNEDNECVFRVNLGCITPKKICPIAKHFSSNGSKKNE